MSNRLFYLAGCIVTVASLSIEKYLFGDITWKILLFDIIFIMLVSLGYIGTTIGRDVYYGKVKKTFR